MTPSSVGRGLACRPKAAAGESARKVSVIIPIRDVPKECRDKFMNALLSIGQPDGVNKE
jgi:hypothetical protein